MKRNHFTRASERVTDVRTGFNPVGVLKRVIRFKSCEKPNDQPVYITVPVGHWPDYCLSSKIIVLTRPLPPARPLSVPEVFFGY